MSAPTHRPRRSFAILPAPDRRGGYRVAIVREIERLESLAGSRVAEVKNRTREHYLPWARVATSPALCSRKLRAILADRARALSKPPAIPEPIRPPRIKWRLRQSPALTAAA